MRTPSNSNNNLNLNFLGGSESRDGGAPNRSAKSSLSMMKAMRGGPDFSTIMVVDYDLLAGVLGQSAEVAHQ
ncbi:hypothetical protein B5807_01461 [Epicoccum nigrum]|uniref:Uncharacterized protein n=1 Tax=Epicoccum nigrum TaxID=105696 RepID=A0A1Y2MFU8_EPING|nr:hypothetical protein B5807_01461 [Epicoccum nigrum]